METGDLNIETAYREIVDKGVDPITGASFESMPPQRREYLVGNIAKVISRISYNKTEAEAREGLMRKIEESEEMAKKPNEWEVSSYDPNVYTLLRTAFETSAFEVSEHYKPNFVQ
ncbi:MAG: hypothetical protein KAJ24_06935 [Candidatus Aenigmarchaeota archaeon]|nr:hypothetical protein [Candidatus Aenigmarchaeota archaeon]